MCFLRWVWLERDAGLDRLARDAYFAEVAKHRPSHIERLAKGADLIKRQRGW